MDDKSVMLDDIVQKMRMLDDLVQKMRDLQNSTDVAARYSEADNILCEALRLFGADDLVEAFHALDKWYL